MLWSASGSRKLKPAPKPSCSDAPEAVFLWSIERRDQSMLLRAGSSAWGFPGFRHVEGIRKCSDLLPAHTATYIFWPGKLVDCRRHGRNPKLLRKRHAETHRIFDS